MDIGQLYLSNICSEVVERGATRLTQKQKRKIKKNYRKQKSLKKCIKNKNIKNYRKQRSLKEFTENKTL